MSRLMYAARDITNTVGCLGLIVSSIISKKVTGTVLYSYCTVLYCTVLYSLSTV